MNSKLGFVKNKWLTFGAGIVLGAAILLGIRYATYMPAQVHYHANFAVYINGQREEFKGAQYYQEVNVCSATNGITIPQQRAHMHDNMNDIIHIHDHATTWGQFFENLGWFVGPNFIQKDDGTMYIADDQNKLHVILNGQDYTDLSPITNVIIKDRAQLLMSYGNVDEATLQQEYKTVPTTADHYDNAKDPASCAGTEKVTKSDRLHHLF